MPKVAAAAVVAVCCGVHLVAVAAFGSAAVAGLLGFGLGVAALGAVGLTAVAVARHVRSRIRCDGEACDYTQAVSPGGTRRREVSPP